MMVSSWLYSLAENLQGWKFCKFLAIQQWDWNTLFIVFSIGFRDSAITIREGEVATLVIQQIGDERGGTNIGGLHEFQIDQVKLQESSGTATRPGQY